MLPSLAPLAPFSPQCDSRAKCNYASLGIPQSPHLFTILDLGGQEQASELKWDGAYSSCCSESVG